MKNVTKIIKKIKLKKEKIYLPKLLKQMKFMDFYTILYNRNGKL